MGWFAPAPGGSNTTTRAPAGTVAGAPGPGGSRAYAGRPRGTQWAAPRPGGSWWSGVGHPPFPVQTEHRNAELAAEGTLSVATVPVLLTGAGFTAEATLSVLTSQRIALAAALAAEATLSVEIEVVGESFENDAPFGADGTLSVATMARYVRDAGLSAEGTLSVATLARYARTAELSAEATLSVQTTARYARVADYSTEATLSVAVQVVPQRGAPLAAEGTLSVLTFPRYLRDAALAGEGTLSVVVIKPTNWTDDFNRANGPLGADWTTFASGPDATVVPEINSNALRAKSTGTNNQNNQCFALATNAAAEATGNNMAVRMTMVLGDNGLICGGLLRASIDGQNMVSAEVTSDSAITGIWTRIGGTWTRRTTDNTSAFTVSDVLEFQALDNVYKLVRNPAGVNTTISTWTDSSNLVPTGAGKRWGGIYHNSDRNVFGTQNWAPPIGDFNVRDLY